MISTKEAVEEVTSPVEPGERLPVGITVNGELHKVTVPADLLLIDLLRDTLALTAAKQGCETGQCGSCVVLLDGVSVKSCAVLAAQADGRAVLTLEGVAPHGSLTPLQASLRTYHAVQCGYCTSALVLSLTDLLSREPHPSEHEVRRWLDGTMCRCGVYQNVVRAIESLTAKP
jgi:carbon-monoxide dehydrogenase small subunit